MLGRLSLGRQHSTGSLTRVSDELWRYIILRHGDHARHLSVLVIVRHRKEFGRPALPPRPGFGYVTRVHAAEEHSVRIAFPRQRVFGAGTEWLLAWRWPFAIRCRSSSSTGL